MMLLDKCKTTLIIVDMQNGACKEGGSLVKLLGIKELRSVPTYPKILSLKKYAKELGMPVIYVKTIFNEDYSNAGLLGKRFPLKEIEHFKVGTWDAEIVSELSPSSEDIIVVKDRWSAFFNTNLDALLKEHKIENIIITGGATDVCVLETATMGFFLDYNCVVPADATFSFSEENERIGITQLSFGRAIVTTTDDVITALQ